MLEKVSPQTLEQFVKDYAHGGSNGQLAVEFLHRFFPHIADAQASHLSDAEAVSYLKDHYVQVADAHTSDNLAG